MSHYTDAYFSLRATPADRYLLTGAESVMAVSEPRNDRLHAGSVFSARSIW